MINNDLVIKVKFNNADLEDSLSLRKFSSSKILMQASSSKKIFIEGMNLSVYIENCYYFINISRNCIISYEKSLCKFYNFSS